MGLIAPEGLYGSLNHLYGYVDQNPINFIDPSGLSTLLGCTQPANWASCMAAGIKPKPKFKNFKYHANKHGNGNAQSYYNSAINNIGSGRPFKFKHNGQNKVCFVTRTGSNNFTITSTNTSGSAINTHFTNATTQYLRNLGITLPKGF